MKLHNTLTKHIEVVQPLDPTVLTMYTCGPTLYDHSHIGNLSSFIIADTLRRVLQASSLHVQHVMNFTDVDDKTIRRSQERFSTLEPREALATLTDEYAQVFIEDMVAIGNDISALAFIKATDSIEPMQQLIQELYKDGFAYIADDGVYFSISAYIKSGQRYGQLSEITAASTSEARIDNDEYDKAAAHDFALWKTQKSGEPAWDFDLDGHQLKGRPGWHIECSAMSRVTLGQPFDIHTGGIDLIFPHHENEIAQSTASSTIDSNKAYAKLFVHNEHLLVDGQKMSKSLNNFHTLQDIVAKGYEPLAFRLLVLQAHYRKQAHFSWDNLTAASNRLQAYRAMADRFWQPEPSGGLEPAAVKEQLNHIKQALQDDLDTPAAFRALSTLEAAIDKAGISTACQEAYRDALEWLDLALGLQLQGSDISEEQKQLIAERQAARQAQDWTRSDELRDQLQKDGISLQDTPNGPRWTRARTEPLT